MEDQRSCRFPRYCCGHLCAYITNVDYCQMSIVLIDSTSYSRGYWSKPQFRLVGILICRDRVSMISGIVPERRGHQVCKVRCGQRTWTGRQHACRPMRESGAHSSYWITRGWPPLFNAEMASSLLPTAISAGQKKYLESARCA